VYFLVNIFADIYGLWHGLLMSLFDVTKEIQAALASLRRGQAFINEEIARLEAFLASSAGQAVPKRRGRPPKNAVAISPAAPVKRGPGRPRKNPVAEPAGKKKPGRRSWTPAQRDAARKRMQEYWSKRKKG
jgi:hypothetical protein